MRKKLFTILSCMMLAIATLMAANSQVDEAMALANRLSPRLAQKVQFKQGKKKSTDYFTLSNNGDKVLITERMLRYFIQKAMGRRAFRKPRISICVPSGVTEVERKAVEEATYQAGAREVLIVPEPVAAAIGSGIDITKPCGNMIVDIGGGTTDIAVISLAGTVVSNSVKISSETFDQDIIRYVRKTYNVFIGEQTAEAVKIRIGSAYPRAEEKTMEIKGRNVITGLPATITVSSDEIRGALAQTTNQIADAICAVLEKTPPELASDVSDRGIILTGGGSLDGMDELIQERTGINTVTAENPASVVALGTGQYREVMNEFESQF